MLMSCLELKDAANMEDPSQTCGGKALQRVESVRKTPDGVVFVPQPSDDPHDPLNWPSWRKSLTFYIVCFAPFAGLGSAIAHANASVVQAETYGVTPTQMSYSLSSAIAGLIGGPILLVPMARVVGNSSCIFWSLVCMAMFGVWSAEMTSRRDYTSFVVSRLFSGLVGSVPQVLGNEIIVSIYFLHQRGRAFVIYSTFFAIGVVAGPTFCGFIVQHTQWPAVFWWSVGLQVLLAVLVFILMEETSRNHFEIGKNEAYHRDEAWLWRRIQLLFPGKACPGRIGVMEYVRLIFVPFKIFFSPVTVLIGVFNLINFGWGVMINSLFSIFLQEPAPHSYGFTPQQNAAFLFSFWIGVLVAQLYGILLNDRIPLYIARRHEGSWSPEYRLYPLWVPGFVTMPIGLGLFGAALEYHLHYMVLALGSFLISFSAVAGVPVAINYVVEAFECNPQEVGTAMNVWRLLLGLVVPFFLSSWEERVGVGWVFGMAAFFSLFAFGLILILIWKGHDMRRLGFTRQSRQSSQHVQIMD